MAKVFDKMLDFLGVENTEEIEEYDDYREPEAEAIRTVRRRAEEVPEPQPVYEKKRKSNLVSVAGGQGRQNMVLYQPQSNEDTQNIIDYMKSHRSVIINLESIEKDTAQRILDYVSGASYALNGKIHKISSEIFLLAPPDASVMNNIGGKERSRDRDDRYDRGF